MKFYIIDEEIKIKEETLDYMAEMMENAKWNGNIVFSNRDEVVNSYRASEDKIFLNTKVIEERAKENGKDADLLLLSVFAHEMYHAVDPDKEIRREKNLEMIEHIYEGLSTIKTEEQTNEYFEGIKKLKEETINEEIIKEAKTNNALDFFPQDHPQLQELNRTFIENNIESNQTYMDGSTEYFVTKEVDRVIEDRINGVPLEEQKDYKSLKSLRKSIEKNKEKTFFQEEFNLDKKISIKVAKERGNVLERMEPKAKMKEQNFEKEIKVKMVKEEIQLSKTTSLTKEEVTISRAYTMATETIKEKTKSSIKEKAVEVFRNIQQSFKQLKEKVSSKQKTNEHTL